MGVLIDGTTTTKAATTSKQKAGTTSVASLPKANVTTGTQTYDPTKQVWVAPSEAVVKTLTTTYDPTRQATAWTTQPSQPIGGTYVAPTGPAAVGGGAPIATGPTGPASPTGPTAPTGPAAPVGTADTLAGFTDAEIGAALQAIEAQFGMTREQLLADQSMIGAQYRLLVSRLQRQQALATAATTDEAVGRGIYRSGILGENLATLESQYMEQFREAEQARLAQEQNVQRQLQFLDAEKEATKAQAATGINRSTLDYRRAAAGV